MPVGLLLQPMVTQVARATWRTKIRGNKDMIGCLSKRGEELAVIWSNRPASYSIPTFSEPAMDANPIRILASILVARAWVDPSAAANMTTPLWTPENMA